MRNTLHRMFRIFHLICSTTVVSTEKRILHCIYSECDISEYFRDGRNFKKAKENSQSSRNLTTMNQSGEAPRYRTLNRVTVTMLTVVSAADAGAVH